MTIRVGTTISRPTHHVKLSRDGKEVGLILCDNNGRADESGLRGDNLPDSAIKMYQGSSTHADAEPPFRPIEQKDWSGGGAARVFEDDASRYYDAGGVDVTAGGKMLLGPLATFTEGLKSLLMDMPGDVGWVDLYGTDRYHSQMYNSGAGFHAYYIECIAYAVGSPGNLTLALYSNSGGNPNALLASASYPESSADDGLPVHIRVSISYGLIASTDYHLVVYGAGTDDADNHWLLAVHGASTGRYSANGSTWAAGSAPYGRITAVDGAFHLRFFEYKRCFYAVKIFDDGSDSLLYRCGYRGVAQSNSGNLDQLVDANAFWPVNGLTGSVVELIRGPGSEETDPWRLIESNTNTELNVELDWKITHTATTEYVVHLKEFIYITSLLGHVSDVAVTDEFVYFARGEGGTILRWWEYNNGGVWGDISEAEDLTAYYLLYTRHPSLGDTLWGALNTDSNYKTVVWRANIPKAWGKLYQDMGEICATDNPWDSKVISGVTQSKSSEYCQVAVNAGISGIVAVQNLEIPVDITKGNRIGVLLTSSKDISANVLQLVYDDVMNVGKAWGPTQATVLKLSDGSYDDLPLIKDGHDGTKETLSVDKQLTTGQHLLIGGAEPFNKITIQVETGNNTAVTFVAYYYANGVWNAVSSWADGTLDSATHTKTLNQTGDMTFTTPVGWEKFIAGNTPVEAYYILLIPTGSVDNTTVLRNAIVERKNQVVLNFPLIYAYKEFFFELTISPNQYPYPNETSIKSFALNLVSSISGGVNLFMRGGVRLANSWPEYIKLPVESRVTGMIAYVQGSEGNENPVIFTETKPYVIEQENNNQLVSLGLPELSTLRSPNSGRASTVQGVYLWFSLGDDYIQRYYNHQLDNVGFNRDEGLPIDRKGIPAKMITWTDKVLAAVDGGETGTSTVRVYNGRGWHEIYRAPKWGWRIRDIAIQTVPGEVDRLWISVNDDAVWMPLSTNPLNENGYKFNYAGYLITSRYTGGMQDTIKYIHSLKLASEQLLRDYVWVKVDYKLAGDNTWNEISETFVSSPYEEIPVSDQYDVTSRWVSLRLRLFTTSASSTPEVYATVLETMMFNQIKFVYSMVFRLADKDIDLNGEQDPVGTMEKFNQINEWVRGALPVLFNSNSKIDDNTYVFPGPTPFRRLKIIHEPEKNQETHICQMQIIGI